MTIEAPPSQIVRVIEETQLGPATAEALKAEFTPLYEQRDALLAESGKIIVTDATQAGLIKASRTMRLKLREVRLKAEKARKAFKDDFVRGGRAIDGIARLISDALEPEEARLQAQEEFAERAEAKRKAETKAARVAILAPFGFDYEFYPLDEMPEAQFIQLHQSFIALKADNERKAREAEEQRLTAETKRLEEETRIREDNLRLQKEAEAKEAELAREREAAAAERAKAAEERRAAQALADRQRDEAEATLRAEQQRQELARAEDRRQAAEAARVAADKARVEREAVDAQARADREARDAAERKLAAQKAAEAKAKAAEEAARRKAERAPDTEKLISLAKSLRAFPLPTVKHADAQAIVSGVSAALAAEADKIEQAVSA